MIEIAFVATVTGLAALGTVVERLRKNREAKP